MDTQRFAARWSRSIGMITLAVIAVVLVVTIGLVRTAVHEADGVRALPIVVAFGLPVALLMAGLFAPLGYSVSPSGIVVHRIAHPVMLRYEQMAEVRRIGPAEIGSTVRAFGSGGFLGWFGRFYGTRLGWFRAYCSSQQDLVLIIRTDGAKVLISPHPADAFIEALQTARRQPA